MICRNYHRWHSSHLDRDMELLSFGHAGERALVFPTRQGRFFDFENWHLVDALAEPLEAGLLQLFCLDSHDSHSFYNAAIPPAQRIHEHTRYEAYLLHEVLPFTAATNPDRRLLATGCSLGAFHAVNLVLRHPQRFTRLLALSGRYDLTKPVGPFTDLFDGFYNDSIYYHTPLHFLPNLTDPTLLDALRRIDITLAVGLEDPFAPSTRELSRILDSLAIPHRLDLWPGEAHRAHHWRDMLRTLIVKNLVHS